VPYMDPAPEKVATWPLREGEEGNVQEGREGKGSEGKKWRGRR